METKTEVMEATAYQADAISLGIFEIRYPVDDRDAALLKLEEFKSTVTQEFFRRHLALSLCYDLSIEVAEDWPGSWNFRGPVKLSLKKGWRKVKKAAPPLWLGVTMILGGIANYPDLKAGAKELGKDIQWVMQRAAEQEKEASPNVGPEVKFFPNESLD